MKINLERPTTPCEGTLLREFDWGMGFPPCFVKRIMFYISFTIFLSNLSLIMDPLVVRGDFSWEILCLLRCLFLLCSISIER